MAASKIRGTMVGALLGDCLGAAFEGDEMVSKVVLQKYFDKLDGPYFKTPEKMYTDDTAMTKSVAESLVHVGNFDEKDMAKRFVDEYFRSPRRGYGQNVVGVFQKLRSSKLEDVWRPAREQFAGFGSYGNGAAMRVAPVALFCRHDYPLMLDVADKTSRLTHTHPLGVNGSVLQCIAVHKCLSEDPKQPIDTHQFTTDLIEKMKKVESNNDYGGQTETNSPYQDQLKVMQNLLSKPDGSYDSEEVVKGLGHSIAALYSVPTAIFCFLRAQAPIQHIQTENPFRRTLQYSISMGGDTDTIASMAGALAGAYLGYEAISTSLQRHCEGVEKILRLADQILKVSEI